MLLFNRCEICALHNVCEPVSSLCFSSASPLASLLPSQLKSFHLSGQLLSFLSNYTPPPFPTHNLSSSCPGSYLFPALGQNNSSQLTPISSLALPLQPSFSLFFHLSIMTAPQDVILSEWFQRLQNICLQHILKQSSPFLSNPSARVWLVWTLFRCSALKKSIYAFVSLVWSLLPPKEKIFFCVLCHSGLRNAQFQLLILSHLHQSFITECFL